MLGRGFSGKIKSDFLRKIKVKKKIRLDDLSESSARQRILMKNQVLFSSKNKSKKLKCRLLQFLFGTLRVNTITSGANDRFG